jgi:hypothetical protein
MRFANFQVIALYFLLSIRELLLKVIWELEILLFIPLWRKLNLQNITVDLELGCVHRELKLKKILGKYRRLPIYKFWLKSNPEIQKHIICYENITKSATYKGMLI